jgi:hypothetical protein
MADAVISNLGYIVVAANWSLGQYGKSQVVYLDGRRCHFLIQATLRWHWLLRCDGKSRGISMAARPSRTDAIAGFSTGHICLACLIMPKSFADHSNQARQQHSGWCCGARKLNSMARYLLTAGAGTSEKTREDRTTPRISGSPLMAKSISCSIVFSTAHPNDRNRRRGIWLETGNRKCIRLQKFE